MSKCLNNAHLIESEGKPTDGATIVPCILTLAHITPDNMYTVLYTIFF